ncbi:DUF309 domain-containing protein [Desertibacillus haloalkaliphilus]|uniref:DUF309 domain-containing protein n=1 Tax=Desertibacillus haloalkaliphilus TaxID=1328930 RepID=UPI001C2673C7|nr:DUF309 domain-containing protein [Desertibacillus haloalkaliphilus]MBU8907881.1 DUF309 domain-containing protein [Desertibacillus haloalkaliphilus]
MYPKAYIDYLVYFHGARDFFECHEVLEEHWKEEGQKNDYWVGLIQVAVALYHQRRRNYRGANRMINRALMLLEQEKKAIHSLGIDYHAFIEELQKRKQEISKEQSYTDMNIPLHDQALRDQCIQICNDRGNQWGQKSQLDNDYLIHKHALRDRQDVIDERNYQKKLRKRVRKE